MQEVMGLVSLQKLRLDSCGSLELPGSLAQLRRLDSVSLRQCHLDSMNCLDRLLSLPSLDVCPNVPARTPLFAKLLPYQHDMREHETYFHACPASVDSTILVGARNKYRQAPEC